MEIPTGCSMSFQVSYIEDEALRPDPEYAWTLMAVREDGSSLATCRKNIEDCVQAAIRFL